jgi:hypothetical protein
MHDRADHGWQKAGDLDLPKPPMPVNAGSTLMSSSSSSMTGGSPQLVNGPPSSIGPQPGGHGAVARRKAKPDLADPHQRTAALVASLSPLVRSSLRVRYEDRIDPEYGWDGEVVGYESGDIEVDERARAQALTILRPWLEPLADREIVAQVARLRASCKVRAEHQDDITLVMRVLAEECADYPADVVVWVLRRWANRERFTPSLAELRDELQRGARARRSLTVALGYRERMAG